MLSVNTNICGGLFNERDNSTPVGEADLMFLKILCINNGLPLWSATYPEETTDNVLLSGFLYAMEVFANAEVGNPIKSMILGDNRWTFSRIYNINSLVIVVQTPILENISGYIDDLKFSENLVKEVLKEFTTRFPVEFFSNGTPDRTEFADIITWGVESLKQHLEYLERRNSGDITWLVNLENADILITALLNLNPILILNNFSGGQTDSDALEKLRASLEIISLDRLFNLKTINHNEDPNFLENSTINTIFLVDSGVTWTQELQHYAIVDLEANKVRGGLEIDPTARKLVLYLQNNPFNEAQVKSIILAEKITPDSKSADVEIQGTTIEVQCRICSSTIKFRTNDASTYLDRKVHEKFLGMNIVTYEIAHIQNEEMHINSVLVDPTGNFYGYVSSYVVPLQNPSAAMPHEEAVKIIQTEPLFTGIHRVFEVLIVMNTKNLWFFPILWSPTMNLEETKKLLLKKVQEIEEMYSDPSEYSNFLVADKKAHVWMHDSLVICAIFHAEEIADGFDLIAKEILTRPINPDFLVSLEDRLKLSLDYLNDTHFTRTDADLVKRLLFDDLLSANLRFKYENHISQIVDRITQNFNVKREDLEAYLNGNTTILDYLKQNQDLEQGRSFLEVVDFLQNRQLLDF